MVLELSENFDDWGILSSVLHSDGAYRDILYVDGGPSSNALVGHVRMEGKEVFRHAVEKLAAVMDEALDAAQMDATQIDWLVRIRPIFGSLMHAKKDGNRRTALYVQWNSMRIHQPHQYRWH